METSIFRPWSAVLDDTGGDAGGARVPTHLEGARPAALARVGPPARRRAAHAAGPGGPGADRDRPGRDDPGHRGPGRNVDQDVLPALRVERRAPLRGARG